MPIHFYDAILNRYPDLLEMRSLVWVGIAASDSRTASVAGILELIMTITEPERLSLEKLRGLASAAPPCISIVLPEDEARDARIAFRDALAQVRGELETRVPKRDIASLLDPIEVAATDMIDSSKEPATFIFLRSPDVCESFRTRYLVGQPVAAVGERFQLRPLLALASKHFEFYILALKLNDTRIFKCTDQFCDAARFPANAGTEGAGFVPGASQASLRAKPVHDRDHPEDHLRHYYREIDRDVNALLKDGHPPLVVVGVEHEVALFHRLTTYPACVEPGVRGLPGHLGQNEMYRQSLELVRSVTTGPARRALERFDKQIGTGHASADVQEIVRAASTGRVEHLLLLENGAIPGAADGGADLLDTAVVQTLRHGGDVLTLPEASMRSGGPICAVFRYASEGS